jgi:phage recombination protein Bet
MSTALTTLTTKLADRFGMGDGADLTNTLKATCFKGQNQVTDAQMTMLLVVAQQYGLNPFTRELFAFPDKGGIVPVVGVDGWARIINSHAQFDGMDFEQDDEKCTCIIYRKDRSHPVKISEYMSECRRPNAQPWQSHPRRMLRHKAMIQCARMAFGFAGIYDQDEAERLVEVSGYVDAGTGEISQGLPAYSDADFAKNLAKWRGLLAAGMDVARLIQGIEKKSRALLTDEQKQTLAESPEIVTDVTPKGEPPMIASEQEAHDAFVAGLGAD